MDTKRTESPKVGADVQNFNQGLSDFGEGLYRLGESLSVIGEVFQDSGEVFVCKEEIFLCRLRSLKKIAQTHISNVQRFQMNLCPATF